MMTTALLPQCEVCVTVFHILFYHSVTLTEIKNLYDLYVS